MAIERIKLNALGVIEETPVEYIQIGEAVIQVKSTFPMRKCLI